MYNIFNKRIVIYILLANLFFNVYSNEFYNIKDFGANGNDTLPDTESINNAIKKASDNGGGTVFFPAGTYISFSIRLKTNITLYLDNGAVLQAADTLKYGLNYDNAEPNEFDQYQDFGHSHWHNSLIWGENLENIAITGHGMIKGTDGLTRRGRRTPGIANKAIALKNCRGVTLSDFSMLMGGHFVLLATGVDNLTIDNVKVDTNRDGFDIDCCKHVRISNCSVNSPKDDAICLKSSYALGYPRITEDVTITNCYVSGFDQTTFLNGTYLKNEANRVPDKGVVTGRIKFGTESNGGFKNITISNCTFEFCRGLALETVDGGILEDVVINNIVMKDIQGAPFFFRLGARLRAPEGTPVGYLRNVIISNIVVYSANPDYCSMIVGIPEHPVQNITMSLVKIKVKGGAPLEQSNNIIEEHISSYPDPQEFGKMPSYAFFIRHAKDIKLMDIDISLEDHDERPAMYFEDVNGITLQDVIAPKEKGQEVYRIVNTNGLTSKNCEPLPDMNNKSISQLKNF